MQRRASDARGAEHRLAHAAADRFRRPTAITRTWPSRRAPAGGQAGFR